MSGTSTRLPSSQRGVVAIIVGLSLVVLVGFLGLALDLGRLYFAKSELQNAADAAALGGAKQLNGTTARICCEADSAVGVAVATAGQNQFMGNFGRQAVDIGPAAATNTWIEFSSLPSGPWVSVADARAAPADMQFIRVNTASGNLATWFIHVLPGALTQTSTFGRAVAGILMTQVVPLGVCAIEPVPGCAGNECGFIRGVSYKFQDLNPLGPGTPLWLHPTATSASSCAANVANVPQFMPFLCQGTVSLRVTPGSQVFSNTGLANTPSENALNSRFGLPTAYSGGNSCDPETAPPDTNVKQYIWNDTAPGAPRNWLDGPAPSLVRQAINLSTGDATGSVRWAHSRPVGATVNQRDYDAATNPTGFLNPAGYPDPDDSYPGSSPYAQTGTTGTADDDYFQAPTGVGAPFRMAGRRGLNVIIVDCPSSGGVCRPLTVLAVGKFFMQRQAQLGGSPASEGVFGEFARIMPSASLLAEVRLYR